MATKGPAQASAQVAIVVDATRPLRNGETDGAWLLLADEDRAELEAEGWRDGRPPPVGRSWWARLRQRLARWKTGLAARFRR